ncbi:Hypothetical protein BN2458_PEG1172 [Helicobacter typhlonius]|uniref:Uncharacterized protein n=1 Tax=Helicobacter typhlonius TaxID=76936 RepID=A0A0S4PUZ1_9HELI|nr:Hypothetical protein BN2458_PEG1172 [Helicobacter typhlonius]
MQVYGCVCLILLGFFCFLYIFLYKQLLYRGYWNFGGVAVLNLGEL